MVKPARSSRPAAPSLEQQVESLRRENAELKARLAKGPVDDSWFTPGVLSLLFLALFGALWMKYVPTRRARPAAALVADAGTAGEYNPSAR